MVNGSVYWIDPESHGIRFYADREKVFEENERYIPSALWYSVEPYIDAAVRKKRFEGIWFTDKSTPCLVSKISGSETSTDIFLNF